MQVIRYTLTSGFLIGAALVFAQSTTAAQNVTLSDGCTSTLKQLVIAPEGECLNLSGLLPLATVGKNDSFVPPLNLWLKGLCSAGKCSDETLTSLVDTVLSGCREDLVKYANLTPEHDDAVKQVILKAYPVARESVCLVDRSTGELCVTETLNKYQNITGTPLTYQSRPEEVIQEVQSMSTDKLKELVCTPCAKQFYNVVNGAFPELASQAATPFKNLCGDSFVDGAPADNVASSASNSQLSSVKSDNGAVQSQYASWLLWLGGAALFLA